MELGKLIIFGVFGMLVFALWQGNADTRKAALAQTSPTGAEEEFIPSPTLYTEPQAAALTTSETAVPQPLFQDDSNEALYDSYATYTYVRERDQGTSNTYSYRVEGCDRLGIEVAGSVNTRGTYGNGYVTNEYGDHYWIETEWTAEGELLGYSKDGNKFSLMTSEIR